MDFGDIEACVELIKSALPTSDDPALPFNKLTENEVNLLLTLMLSEEYDLARYKKLVDSITKEAKKRKQQPLF